MSERNDFSEGIERELTILSRHQLLPGKDRVTGKLDRSAYLVLRRLDAHPAPAMAPLELANAFNVDMPTMQPQIDELLRKRLVEYAPGPGVGSVKKLRPTEAAREHLRHDRANYKHELQKRIDHWSADDRRDFLKLLEQFNDGPKVRRAPLWPRPQRPSVL
jgi:DNA-binding MarR family transcriptional regulator